MTKLIITDKNIHQKVKEFYKNKKSIKKNSKLHISNWDTSKVTNMKGLFHIYPLYFEEDISGWDVSNVKNMEEMFRNKIIIQIYQIGMYQKSKI